MSIQYACVANRTRRIITDCSLDSKLNFRAVVTSMLPNIATQPAVRKIYLHERFNFVVLPSNDLFYICTASPGVPEENTFEFLEEVVKTFDCENNNLSQLGVSGDEAGRNGDVEDGDLGVTVVDGLGVKNIRKFPHALKKKMKKYARKTNKKSKNFFIPRKRKTSHFPTPFVTPASKELYVPLQEDSEDESKERENEENARAYAPHGQTIYSLQQEVEEVQEIVRESIEKVLKRGENIEDLLVRADNLKETAYQFQKTSGKLKTKFKRRHRKLVIAAVVGTGTALTAVTVVLIHVLTGVI